MRYGDAVLIAQHACERVHDDLCPAAADGIGWHQCRWRPSLIAAADALDAVMGAGDEDPARAAALALHARSCIDDACGPEEAAAHAAEKYHDAALSLCAYVDEILGPQSPPVPVADPDSVR